MNVVALMKERALTVAIFLVLGVASVAWQGYGLPDGWLADEISSVVVGMVARGSFNPRHFMYPSLMVDVCAAVARLTGTTDGIGIVHICRTVSAAFFLLAVFCAGRTVELVLEKKLPFAYFFMGTIGAFLHHAHIATVNSCFFFTIMLAQLQFIRTIKSGRERDFYLSVLACSLAVGAKYNGCFLFGTLPLLWLLALEKPLQPARFARALAVSLLLAPLPFLATTPYALLDSATFESHWNILTKVEGPAFKGDAGPLTYFKTFFACCVAFFTPAGLLLLTGWGLSVYGAWLSRWRQVRAERPLVFNASLVLGWTFAVYHAMNWRIGILQGRYYLPAALTLGLLFLIALHGASATRLRTATIALLLVFGAANTWANVVCFRLAAKSVALDVLAPLEGRIGVVAYPTRWPFTRGPLDSRCDVFLTDTAEHDVASFEDYLSVIERFFAEKKPRWIVFEEIIVTWPSFRPRKDAADYGARLRYPNPGLEAWEAHLARAGYRRDRVIGNCEGPLAMRWLIGSFYLTTAEGVGRPVYLYERRP